MNESERSTGVKVNDRRRFDNDGNPRSQEAEQRREEPQVPSQEPPAAAQPEEDVEQLKRDLQTAQRRVDELARAIQAGEREREDFKKRLVRERERMLEVEKGNVAQTLLETVDELDLCLGSADDSPFSQGVRMIREALLSRLAALGVERVALLGRPFDPNLAEAIDMDVTSEQDQDQQVTAELRSAWRLNDRLIRPGRVKVARYFPSAEA